MTRRLAVFAGRPAQRAAYEPPLRKALADRGLTETVTLVMDPAEADPAEVDYLIYAASGPVTVFTPYTRLRAILNLWAGVEAVLELNPPRGVPIARMVEPGLSLGMVDYVAGHVLRHHLDIDRYIAAAPGTWDDSYPPLARDRKVGILGVGALGTACGQALAQFGFDVQGWASRPREIEGITCRTGAEGLADTLAMSEILVLLLPLTPQTEGVLDAAALALLPKGACIVNAARGPLIDDAALLAALDRGHIRHATLDVFATEPLPAADPYWRHPRVTVTPHVASATRPETASIAVVENIARDLAGEPLLAVVDRERGY
jgi:glyoxylate/hydroxypyruvate reductase A